MKDIIVLEKDKKKEKLLIDIMDKTILAEVAWVSNLNNFDWRYKWAISNVDLDIAKKLRQTGIRKY